MKLKKINENLQQALIENGLTEANEMQQETFSTLKSGADCIIVAPKGSGKSTTIVLNVIQQLKGEGEESPRALIIVEDKAKVLEMEELFEKYGKYTDLRVYGVHDKGFQGLLELLRNHKAWVKMTGPYRICDGDFPYADMRAFNDEVIKANSQRLIWGSDWPHVMVTKQMPHDADLCDLFGSWVSDPNLRKSILSDNPCMLYDFPAFTGNQ